MLPQTGKAFYLGEAPRIVFIGATILRLCTKLKVHVHEKMAAAMNLYPAAGAVGDVRDRPSRQCTRAQRASRINKIRHGRTIVAHSVFVPCSCYALTLY